MDNRGPEWKAPIPPSKEASPVECGHTAESSVVDHRELVWNKLQSLREKYYQDMSELLKMLIARSQTTMPADQLQKLNHYREVLSRMIPYLSASKNNLPKEFTLDKVEAFEKQIVSIMETFKRRKPQQQQQQQLQQQQVQHHQQATLMQQSGSQLQHQQGPMPSQSMQQSSVHQFSQASNIPSLQPPSMQSSVMNPVSSNMFKQQQELLQRQRLSKLQQSSQMPVSMQQQLQQHEDSKQDVRGRALLPAKRLPIPASNQLKTGSPQLPASSPQILQASSPQLAQQMSPQPQPDQQSLTIPKVGTPMQPTSTPPFMTPSPLLSVTSPTNEDGDHKPQAAVSSALQPFQSAIATPVIGTPGISASPFLEFPASPAQGSVVHDAAGPGTPFGKEDPLQRVLRLAGTITPKNARFALKELNALMSLSDKLAASAPGPGSRGAVGEDLAASTKCRLQARALVGSGKKRHFNSVAVSFISPDGTVVNSLENADDEDESVVTSRFKKIKGDVNLSLQREIEDVNESLIETVVRVSENDAEDGKEGVVLTLSYVPVQWSDSGHSDTAMTTVSPLRVLVPPAYPKSPPTLLSNQDSNSDHALSLAAREGFNQAVRSLGQPLTIKSLAKAWDECARKAVRDATYPGENWAMLSDIGVWETCIA